MDLLLVLFSDGHLPGPAMMNGKKRKSNGIQTLY